MSSIQALCSSGNLCILDLQRCTVGALLHQPEHDFIQILLLQDILFCWHEQTFGPVTQPDQLCFTSSARNCIIHVFIY